MASTTSSSCSQSPARKALLEGRARYMRFHPTSSEALLFSVIRGGRLGVGFKRQVVIGNAIVDFLAKKASLVIEVDGDVYHATRVHADAARDCKLQRAGYQVLHIPASLIHQNLAAAVALIRQALAR